MQVNMDEETIRSMYYDQGLSQEKIARRLGVSRGGVDYYFRKFGLKGRKPWEYPPKKPRHIDLNAALLDILNGELLGDGCLRQRSKQAAFFAYGTSCYEYVEWLVGRLQGFGVEFGPFSRQVNRRGHVTWFVESKSYAEFAVLRQRWYPNGKKIVPDDLPFSCVVALHWYLGDGSLSHREGRPNVILATNAFSGNDREKLLRHLRVIGVTATTDGQGRIIVTNKASIHNWFSHLPPCPVQCYQYKWRIQ